MLDLAPMLRKLPLLALLSSAFGCVSNQEQFSNNLELDLSAPAGARVEAKGELGFYTAPTGPLEWLRCVTKAESSYVLLLSPEDAPFGEMSCYDPLAQAFLQKGYNVLAVNRPGAGKSQGKESFGDDATLEGVKGLLKEQRQGRTIDGLWATGEASVLGFRVARDPDFAFIIVGNGLYDWEQTLAQSQDKTFALRLKEAQGSDSRYSESRSVAWDVTGLPKTVALYHDAGDLRFPLAQAELFRDALASNQYKTQLVIFRPTEAQAKMTPQTEQSILVQILTSFNPPAS